MIEIRKKTCPHEVLRRCGASAGTRTRVQALATLGDNHYTTLAGIFSPKNRGINGCRLIEVLI